MAFPQRLPIVTSDDGQWGDILNQFITTQHYNGDTNLVQGTSTNGGHQTVTILAGTATAGTAPLKFASGTLLTTAESGAVEFNTNKLYYTTTTPARMTIAAYLSSSTVAAGDLHYADGTGTLTTLPIGITNGMVLTVSSGVPVWQTPGSGLTQQQTMAISSMRI